jgi:hypothetical protein
MSHARQFDSHDSGLHRLHVIKPYQDRRVQSRIPYPHNLDVKALSHFILRVKDAGQTWILRDK